jgi:hypothetical protein
MNVSAQIIVFNGLSVPGLFNAVLNNLYPVVSEILIAEGAVAPTNANKGDATWATETGRSTDGTVSFLQDYPDPEHKIKIFTKDGFWDGKLEMCNKIAENATGDWIYQVDYDEVIPQQDLIRIFSLLKSEPHVERVDFYARQFFGDWTHCVEPVPGPWINQFEWRRIFKHSPGSEWLSHTPPTYCDASGKIMGLRHDESLFAPQTLWDRDFTKYTLGVELFHYSMVTRAQAAFKQKYYAASGVDYLALFDAWQEDHSTTLVNGDRTTEFLGEHPEAIQKLLAR